MICTNMKGWDQKVMSLSNFPTRGESRPYYEPINGVLFGQWKDNKVVLFISTIPLVGMGTTTRQCGKENISFPWPNTLKEYNKYMGHIDLIDYDKKFGGLFTQKSFGFHVG